MKLIIAGGRDFNDLQLALKSYFELCAEVTSNTGTPEPFTEIVSGGAKGADKIGEDVARLCYLPVKRFIPDWDGLGKRAGFVRNAEMGDYADALLAFWNKESRGTKHMIDYATKKGLTVKVVYYEKSI